jgi:hypothetical protein
MRRTWAIVAGVGILVTILVVVVESLASSPTVDEAAPPNRAPAPEELGCGGSPTSLDEAAGAMPFTMKLPDTSLANKGGIQQVLLCSDDQVEIDFESGVILTLGVNHLADPATEWDTLAKQYPEFSTGTVRGLPASLADPSKDALGGVDLVEEGVRMTVTGNGSIPLTDLIAVAESLAPIGSPSPSPTASPTTA